jgi:hypothetical protein
MCPVLPCALCHVVYNLTPFPPPQAEINVLLHMDNDGGSYELMTFANDANGSGEAPDVRRGTDCLAAVFIARDRFLVLDKSRQLLVMNFSNEVVKKISPPITGRCRRARACMSCAIFIPAHVATRIVSHPHHPPYPAPAPHLQAWTRSSPQALLAVCC